MSTCIGELNPPARLLMGPGPSNVHPRVLRALSMPLLGHLDPAFLQIMNETRELLQEVCQTKNRLTLPVSGTGTAGMETCLANLLEPGDGILICINGYFGGRMKQMAERMGASVRTLEVPWGEVFGPEVIGEALAEKPTKVVAIVMAETSTGALQSIEPVSRVVHKAGALLLVDAVTALGGCEVKVDEWEIDAFYSGTQKCLSCPPGLAPASFSERALAAMDARKTPVQSWYFDMALVRQYWGEERVYHHTAPINMVYALREALRMVLEEGLEAAISRHYQNHRVLVAGIENMGLKMHVAEPHRLPMLNTVCIPDGADDVAVRKALLGEYGIEVGAGLGELKGKVWRVGLMGHSSRKENVTLFLAALRSLLGQ